MYQASRVVAAHHCQGQCKACLLSWDTVVSVDEMTQRGIGCSSQRSATHFVCSGRDCVLSAHLAFMTSNPAKHQDYYSNPDAAELAAYVQQVRLHCTRVHVCRYWMNVASCLPNVRSTVRISTCYIYLKAERQEVGQELE
jgi:hypothetical protein